MCKLYVSEYLYKIAVPESNLLINTYKETLMSIRKRDTHYGRALVFRSISFFDILINANSKVEDTAKRLMSIAIGQTIGFQPIPFTN